MFRNILIVMALVLSNFLNAQISQQEFESVMKVSGEIYAPVFLAKGMEFQSVAVWGDDSVNAHAENWDELRKVVVFGGLARLENINVDGIRAMFCHETGHHIAGYPFHHRLDLNWASSEGQADYWASSSCLKKLYENLDNESYLKTVQVPEYVSQKCTESFSEDKKSFSICVRSALAGYNLMDAFNQKYNKGKYKRTIRFSKPDRALVPWSWPEHNNVQCRTDSYFQGALCAVDGNCRYDMNLILGMRPKCWFFPGDEDKNENFMNVHVYTGPSIVN